MNRFLFIFLILITFLYPLHAQKVLNQPLGNLTEFKQESNGVRIKTSMGEMIASVYSPNIIRIRISKTAFLPDFSYAIVSAPGNAKFTLEEATDQITLSTDSLKLVIRKQPVRLQLFNKQNQLVNEDEPAFGTSWLGEQVTTYKKLQPNEKFIGLGEKTGSLNRKGEGYTNWNTDAYGYNANADPIYQSLPFYMGIHGSIVYGIFMDNSYKSHFNFGASNDRFASFMAESGEMNYYLIHHSSVAKIIESYTYLTGRMEMPPLWSLGLQQSRYSYYPESEVLNIAKTYREKGIPADAVVLDIHYMDAYKIFTWDKERFANPKRMMDQLKAMGFHTVVIVDPGIKVEKGYPAYEEGVKQNLFAKYPDGTNYTGQVWPGWCHFPDFTNPKTREWWGQSFKNYVEAGVEGFWNDMNEPATWGNRNPDMVEFDFDGNKGTHREAHNIYGLNMARSTFEGTRKLMNGKRPFLLTRAGFSGVQRYSAVWTGDNVSTDEHMMSGVRLLNSMGLTGLSFTGMDVGGFTGGPSQNLFGRWVSIGAFSPLFRIHSAVDTKEADPWSFGEKIEAVTKNYIQLRYNLMPYLYSTFHESTQTGMPVSRSLAINYTFDNLIYDARYQNQYFFGPGLMVAPSESTKEFTRVYLPDDNGWYDFYNDKFFATRQEIVAESPVDRLPLFVKGGSVIPMQSPVQHTKQLSTDTLHVHVYNGKQGSSFVYYEDDGETYQFKEGSFHKRVMTLDPVKKTLVLEKGEGKLNSRYKNIKVFFHGFPDLKNDIAVGGKKTTIAEAKVQFMAPLPSFDPTGATNSATRISTQSLVIPNSNNRITVNW